MATLQISDKWAPHWDAERMFVFCSCSCSGWVGVRVRVRVRLNGCFVRVPVRAERLFVFGERCSGAALVINLILGNMSAEVKHAKEIHLRILVFQSARRPPPHHP